MSAMTTEARRNKLLQLNSPLPSGYGAVSPRGSHRAFGNPWGSGSSSSSEFEDRAKPQRILFEENDGNGSSQEEPSSSSVFPPAPDFGSSVFDEENHLIPKLDENQKPKLNESQKSQNPPTPLKQVGVSSPLQHPVSSTETPFSRRHVSVPKIQLNFKADADRNKADRNKAMNDEIDSAIYGSTKGLPQLNSFETPMSAFQAQGTNLSSTAPQGRIISESARITLPAPGEGIKDTTIPKEPFQTALTKSVPKPTPLVSSKTESLKSKILPLKPPQLLTTKTLPTIPNLPQIGKPKKRPKEHKAFACDVCRVSKTKCEGGQPCVRCKRLKKNCTRGDKDVLAKRRKVSEFDSLRTPECRNLAKHLVGFFKNRPVEADSLVEALSEEVYEEQTQCYRNKWCIRTFKHPGHCKRGGARKRRKRNRESTEPERNWFQNALAKIGADKSTTR